MSWRIVVSCTVMGPLRLARGTAAASFAFLFEIAFLFSSVKVSYAQVSDAEKATYANALAYCRGDVARPGALRADKRVLCLDGRTSNNDELWLANGLERDGVFVVRSEGGNAEETIALANLLLLKEATVVVNDYCLATCADYLFIATAKTFVPKEALVAWTAQPSGENHCIEFVETTDPRAPRLTDTPCSGSGSLDARNENLLKQFYYGRAVTTKIPEHPPESITVRKILKRKFDQTGERPAGVYWTWNPRYYASVVKANVFYEAYPQSQDEVDAITSRLGLSLSVIYDP